MERPVVVALLAVLGVAGCGYYRHERPPRLPLAVRPAPAAMAKVRVFVDVRHAAANETTPNAPQARCTTFQAYEGAQCPPAGGQEALARAISAALVEAGMVVVTDPTVDYDLHLRSELVVQYRGGCRSTDPSALIEKDREPAYCAIVTLSGRGATFNRDPDRARATLLEGAITHMAEGRECGTRRGAGYPMWLVPDDLEHAYDPRGMAAAIANHMTDCDALVSFARELEPRKAAPSSSAVQPEPPRAPPPARQVPLPSVAPTQT